MTYSSEVAIMWRGRLVAAAVTLQLNLPHVQNLPSRKSHMNQTSISFVTVTLYYEPCYLYRHSRQRIRRLFRGRISNRSRALESRARHCSSVHAPGIADSTLMCNRSKHHSLQSSCMRDALESHPVSGCL